jgi:F-type H+-transporting ATPase subunit delta
VAVAHRIYAQSLVDAAKGRDRLQAVREEFGDFAEAVRSSDELRALLRSPEIDRRVKRDALDAVLSEGDELVRNFVRLIAEKNRIGELEAIHGEFERICAAEERVLQLTLTTAVDISDEDADEIARRIEEASGRPVSIARETDPSLIGGLVLQADSQRVDASVRGRLDQLRQELVTKT